METTILIILGVLSLLTVANIYFTYKVFKKSDDYYLDLSDRVNSFDTYYNKFQAILELLHGRMRKYAMEADKDISSYAKKTNKEISNLEKEVTNVKKEIRKHK